MAGQKITEVALQNSPAADKTNLLAEYEGNLRRLPAAEFAFQDDVERAINQFEEESAKIKEDLSELGMVCGKNLFH
ncbi:MAG: hypothetical protein LUE11_04700, partial [Clostridia bacterium]|nr:hypothetical protein [Clostridia bacterium]